MDKYSALRQLYPNKSDAELEEIRTKNTETIQYEEIAGTPFRYAKKDNYWYLLMGNRLMEQKGFDTRNAIDKWIEENKWELILRVCSSICYDMVKPYVMTQALKEKGIKVNEPEIIE